MLVAVQVKAIQHRQITLPGHAESMGNALGQEGIQQAGGQQFLKSCPIVPKDPETCQLSRRCNAGACAALVIKRPVRPP
jgi:hypothetical protein